MGKMFEIPAISTFYLNYPTWFPNYLRMYAYTDIQ
jgi:hypothetical protein